MRGSLEDDLIVDLVVSKIVAWLLSKEGREVYGWRRDRSDATPLLRPYYALTTPLLRPYYALTTSVIRPYHCYALTTPLPLLLPNLQE